MICWRRRVKENGSMKAKDQSKGISKTLRLWNNRADKINNTGENKEKSESREDKLVRIKIM